MLSLIELHHLTRIYFSLSKLESDKDTKQNSELIKDYNTNNVDIDYFNSDNRMTNGSLLMFHHVYIDACIKNLKYIYTARTVIGSYFFSWVPPMNRHSPAVV